MRNLRSNWRGLPFEKKLAIVVAPLLIALVAGVLVPIINGLITPEPPPKVLGAKLSNIEVETGVTLDIFSERHRTVASTRSDSVAVRRAWIVMSGATRVRSVAVAVQDVTQTAPPDRDGDGVADAQDACPDQAANTANGCPPGGDRDGDGVADAQDACPDQAANTANGCPPGGDRDGDGIPNAADNCPAVPNLDQQDRNHDGKGDACESIAFKVNGVADTGCATPALSQALKGDASDCSAVLAVVGPNQSGDAEKTAQKMLDVLRRTRTHSTKPGGRRKAVGVAVSFDVTLEGRPGRQADVRWSLHHAHGGGLLPEPWLVRHRVLRLTGEANTDTGSGDFWVPLPKPHGPYKVRIEVFGANGSRLTYRDTPAFF